MKHKEAGKEPKEQKGHVPQYLCGICKDECIDEPTQYSEESILCDRCPLWYHLKCVGIAVVETLKNLTIKSGIAQTVKNCLSNNKFLKFYLLILFIYTNFLKRF